MTKYRIKRIVGTNQWLNHKDREPTITRFIDLFPHYINKICSKCSCNFNEHGFIENTKGNYLVCPGDYIITKNGDKYPYRPNSIEGSSKPWIEHGENSPVERLTDIFPHYRNKICPECNCNYTKHGLLINKKGNHIVCPGNYIITKKNGEKYIWRPDIL